MPALVIPGGNRVDGNLADYLFSASYPIRANIKHKVVDLREMGKGYHRAGAKKLSRRSRARWRKVDDSAKAQERPREIDFSLLITSSVMFNAIYVPGGEKSIAPLQGEADALNFINEAYQHFKSLAVTGAGVELLGACRRWPGKEARGLCQIDPA
jgi:hypothetical protein